MISPESVAKLFETVSDLTGYTAKERELHAKLSDHSFDVFHVTFEELASTLDNPAIVEWYYCQNLVGKRPRINKWKRAQIHRIKQLHSMYCTRRVGKQIADHIMETASREGFMRRFFDAPGPVYIGNRPSNPVGDNVGAYDESVKIKINKEATVLTTVISGVIKQFHLDLDNEDIVMEGLMAVAVHRRTKRKRKLREIQDENG